MVRTVQSVINGQPVTDAPGGIVTTVNPADTSVEIARVELGDADTFVAACRAAKDAQAGWAATPAPVRGRVIQQMGRIVEANKEALARLVTAEIGKPYAESLGEVQEIIDTCDFFLGEGRRLYGMTVPSEMPDKQLFTFRKPVGVVAVITAGNFPVAVPAWYIVPALLCGNTCVWKPAEYSAAIADAFFQIMARAGAPAGAIQIVHTDGQTTSAGLEAALEAGVVDKIGFTGSSVVGRKIGELAGRHLQVPCLELGGKNPMVVMPDANMDLAVEGALFSAFGTAGQRCTSLGTAFIHDSIHDEFVEKFAAAAAGAAMGDPMHDVVLGPLMNQRFADSWMRHFDHVEAGKHEILGSDHVGMVTTDAPRSGFVGDPSNGLYGHPAIVTGITADDWLYREETFGPLCGVGRFGDLDEAIELANGHGYGLSSSIYTTDPTSAFRFRERISAGMLSINNSTSGAEAHLPFGGNGRSGNGSRQSGVWVLDQFTRWQSVNWDFAGKLQKAQMDVIDVSADLDFRLG